MKTHLGVAGAVMVLAASVAQAATTTALFDGFDSTDLSAWRHSTASGPYTLPFVVKDNSTRNPGFGTGNYMTNNRVTQDDDLARQLQSNATLVAGGKITYSIDYVAKDSDAYTMRFGIYGGSSNVKDNFASWGSALSDTTGTSVDWAGYLGDLSLKASTTYSGGVSVAKNTSTSNFIWGGSSLVKGPTGTSARNDGTARTAAMTLTLSADNKVTVSLFDVVKGAALDTPVATNTYVSADSVFTNFNYIGFVIRSTTNNGGNAAVGSDTDYIAFDNITVSVETPNPVPEAATMGLIFAGGAALLVRRR